MRSSGSAVRAGAGQAAGQAGGQGAGARAEPSPERPGVPRFGTDGSALGSPGMPRSAGHRPGPQLAPARPPAARSIPAGLVDLAGSAPPGPGSPGNGFEPVRRSPQVPRRVDPLVRMGPPPLTPAPPPPSRRAALTPSPVPPPPPRAGSLAPPHEIEIDLDDHRPPAPPPPPPPPRASGRDGPGGGSPADDAFVIRPRISAKQASELASGETGRGLTSSF